MLKTILSVSLGCCFVLSGGAVRAEDQWGKLTGRFVYEGDAPAPKPAKVEKDVEAFGKLGLIDETVLVDPKGGLANVAIYVKTADVKIHPDIVKNLPDKVTIDNKGGRFEPHVLLLWVPKQTLIVHNSDGVGHNTNVTLIGDASAFNQLIPGGEGIERKIAKKQQLMMPVQCNIHPWMNARILPRDNPYFAVSKPDGTFAIENLPAGELEFVALHEKVRLDAGLGKAVLKDDKKTKTGGFLLTIKPGDNDLGDIKLTRQANPKLYQ